jgi:hypothetical protein
MLTEKLKKMAKTRITSAVVQKKPPPPPPTDYVMDIVLSNLTEISGLKSKTAVQINLLALEYDKKCIRAKIELYNEIQKLFKSNFK